jgi:hypothetical protein
MFHGCEYVKKKKTIEKKKKKRRKQRRKGGDRDGRWTGETGDDGRAAFVPGILPGTNVTTTFVSVGFTRWIPGTNEGYHSVQMFSSSEKIYILIYTIPKINTL